jgi:hypothetical protein
MTTSPSGPIPIPVYAFYNILALMRGLKPDFAATIGDTVWRPEPEPRAEAEQAAGPEASAAAPRKPARPRKARKGTAGPGSAQDASQGQPGAADEATIDPDKQAGGLPVGTDG